MRISNYNKSIADQYCRDNEYELLGYKPDGFAFRNESGKTKVLTYRQAGQELGIEQAPRKRYGGEMTISEKIMKAVMDDMSSFFKYEAEPLNQYGQLIFEIPAYKCICTVIDQNYVQFQAYYRNELDGSITLSIDRKVRYQ